jgi:hypothetical protein
MMNAITIFEENNFIFSFVSNGLVKKSFDTRCTFEEVARKTRHQKMDVNLFYNEIRMNHLT